MKNIIFEKVPIIKTNCVFSDHEGEKVILNVETGKYFKLNSIGSRVFNLMAQNKNIESIIKLIKKDFDLNTDAIEEDVLAFINQCKDFDLVKLS